MSDQEASAQEAGAQEAVAPGAREVIVGIDLGTSNSVAAFVRDGQAFVAPDAQGHLVHPTVVAFTPAGHEEYGVRAFERMLNDGPNTVFSAKRLIGRRFADAEVQRLRERVAYKIKPDRDGFPLIETRAGTFTVPQIAGRYLAYLKGLTEKHVGRAVERAVVTVPASFNNLQRQATKEAGEIAGFTMVRVLNEPTAAALAYGFARGLKQRIAVFDFGGGTLDITVLNVHEHIFEVLSTAGDTALGGDDIDIRLAELMAAACLRTHRYDVRHDHEAMSRLRRYAEQLKCLLSDEEKVVITIPQVAYGEDGAPMDLPVSLDRAGFEQRIADLADRCIATFEEALKLAEIKAPTLLDDVILIGGSTRIPLVRRRLTEFFGKPPRQDINPMQAVALGAAVHGASLGESPLDEVQHRVTLLDVTPRALGIGIVGGYCEALIPRNTMVPAEATRGFATSRDGQTLVRIPICQGESRLLADNVSLGALELAGLPARPRGAVTIDVTFEINTDGLLEVRAIEKATGRKQRVRIVLDPSSPPPDQAATRVDPSDSVVPA